MNLPREANVLDPILVASGVLDAKTTQNFIFMDHNFGSANWQYFILAILLVAFSLTAGEAVSLAVQFTFKRILKIHKDYAPLMAVFDLLMVTQNMTTESAKTILRQMGIFDSKKINFHLSEDALTKHYHLRSTRIGFYNTNFFELLYFTLYWVTIVVGLSISFYVIQYDFTIWITSVAFSSVIVIYGFMPYIQNRIAFILSLYNDKFRVGKIIELPNGKIGCILELHPDNLVVGVLNQSILNILLNKDDSTRTKSTLTFMSSNPDSYPNGHNLTEVVTGNFSGTITDQSEIPYTSIKSHTSPIIIPMPIPVNSNDPTHYHGSNHSSSNKNVNILKSVNNSRAFSDDEKIHFSQRLLIRACVPNITLYQSYYENRPL